MSMATSSYNPWRLTTSARTYHHGNLREALLTAAESALASGGDLSLRALARQVGVSHAAPRRHFADKQALLDELAEDGFARLGASLREAIAEGDFEARLLGFARAYVAFAVEHAALLDVMWAGKHRVEAVRNASDQAFVAPLALIADAQAAGEVVAGDIEHVATIAVATLHGLAAMVNNGMLAAEQLDEIVPATVERLLLGLRPRTS
jgi:AcrR family transcriptional regulator